MNPAEFAALFRQVFKGRDDVVPRYYRAKRTGKAGYSPICKNRFKEGVCRLPCRTCPNPSYVGLSDDLLSQHFNGKEILGVYPLLPDGSCWFVAADFDDHGDNGGPPRDPLRDAVEFHACCEAQGVPCYLERSKSGKGFHVWIFFNAHVPAWKARAVAFALLREAGVIGEDQELSSFDRLFPNQDWASGKGFGNLIAMPYQGKAAENGHTLFLDPASGFTAPLANHPEALRNIQRATEADLDRIIDAWGLKPANSRQAGPPGDTKNKHDLTASGCAFVNWCRENPAAVPEPLWYALISNVARLPGGRSLCHEISRGHPKYEQGETDSKILQALDASGPHTCEWIRKNGYACGRDCRVKAPVATLRRQGKDQEGENDKEPSHLVIARSVVASFGEGNLINTAAFTWKWNGTGVWKQVEPREIKQRIHENAPDGMIKKSFVDSVHDLVQTEVYRTGHHFDQDRHAINLANGELKWTGSTWQFHPHCRESYRTTMLPVAYDPKAKAPRFERFLAEIFRDDEDQVQKSCLAFEMLGYCLLSSCDYEKFFILIGPGANGKSVLMHILSKLVGPEHVSAVQPNQFDNRFQRAHLHGKLVNLVTEIAEGHEIADAQLKAITSGELTTAEHKHRPPFDFHPFSTCVFGTNHMPHTRDFSEALFRRAIIISFNRTFYEEEQDKALKVKLEKELPGILNLSLEALKGVLTRGVFTMPASTQEAKAEWRVECDQVAQFIEDRCNDIPGNQVESGHLFKTYQEWAKGMGIQKLVGHKNFTGRLKRLGYEPGRGTGGIRAIFGLALK